MDIEVTDSVQPLSLEPASFQALTNTLQVLLATGPTLALLVLVGEVPAGASNDTYSNVKVCLDEVEQSMLACFRRSDRVVRCGEEACAALLFEANIDGALHAVERLRRMLSRWSPLSVSLRAGIAAAPEQAAESQTLLALALQPRLSILPLTDVGKVSVPGMAGVAACEPAMTLALPKARATQAKAGKAAAHASRAQAALPTSKRALDAQHLLRDVEASQPMEALTRARARALGVPYIAPPRHIPGSVRSLLSVEVMRQLRCLPIGRDRNALTVALADPTNRSILLHLEQITGLTIFPVMTDLDALEELAQAMPARRASRVASTSVRPSGD